MGGIYLTVFIAAVSLAVLAAILFVPKATDGMTTAGAFGTVVSGFCTFVLLVAAAVDHAHVWGNFREFLTILAATGFSAASAILVGRWYRARQVGLKSNRS